MKRRKFLFIVFLLHAVTSSIAQNVEFEHLSKDGLISTQITCILKDYQGFMWFGTYQGLSRFDGYTYTNFVNDPLDSTTISDNYIYCCHETKNHALIVGFRDHGVGVFNRATESFIRYKRNAQDSSSLAHNFISTIFEDSKGNIWLGTIAGIEKFDIQSGKFKYYQVFSENAGSVTSIQEDDDHNLLLYGPDRKLCKFDPEKITYEYFDFSSLITTRKSIKAVIKYDSKKNIWIGENGLYRFNPQTKEFVTYQQQLKLEDDFFMSIIEDSDHNIWCGVDGKGVYVFNYSNDKFLNFANIPGDPYSLSANGVYAIYESDPGLVWVGVYSGGVNVYKKNKRKFKGISNQGKEGYKLKANSVFRICNGPDDKILLGTDGGGLNILNPKTGKIEIYTTQNSKIHSNIIKSIAVDKDSNVWLGSYGKGLCKINLKRNSFYTFPIEGDSNTTLKASNVWSLCATSDNRMFIAFINEGFQIYDPKTGILKHRLYDPLHEADRKSTILAMKEDDSKRVWFGNTDFGLSYYDLKTDKITYFINDSKNPNSLSSNEVNDILNDRNGNIWIGTNEAGMDKLIDVKNKKFEHYTVKNGLTSNIILGIIEDHHGNLWITTEKGLSLLNVKENKFYNFTKEDGLISEEFNYNSKLITMDGSIYFGGVEGLVYFHPDSMKFNQHAPPVVLTDIKILNQSIKPNKYYDGKIYLKNAISQTKEIALDHWDNIFSIEFTALDYISPENNKFAYKLEGFDEKWSHVPSSKRFATYTNLDPGVYTFKVMACNNDDVWNKNVTTLKIIILPPWWGTWWFKLMYIVTIVLFFVGFYNFRIQVVQRRNKLLKEAVRLRTLELEKSNKTKDKFLSIIGHDLKGPVTALDSLSNMLKLEWDSLQKTLKDDASDKKMSSEIDRAINCVNDDIIHLHSSSLHIKKLVLNLLEWARSQSGQVKLESQEFLISKLFEEVVTLLSAQAKQKEIIVEFQANETNCIYGDYNMLNTVIRNILSNSIKYTPRGGKINLSSSATHDAVLITIKDTGVGMEENTLQKLFSTDKGASIKGTEKETGTGLGLLLCYEFIQLHKGKIWAESTLGKGSVFYLSIPVKALVK